jgi:hypothetical protein
MVVQKLFLAVSKRPHVDDPIRRYSHSVQRRYMGGLCLITPFCPKTPLLAQKLRFLPKNSKYAYFIFFLDAT